MFILRHLVHAAKQITLKGCSSHLHTAFIDLKQACDTIQTTPFGLLVISGFPLTLLMLSNICTDGDEYVLIDGAKTTSTGNSAVPLRDVKRGCPLSPILFSLFINDVDDEFGVALWVLLQALRGSG